MLKQSKKVFFFLLLKFCVVEQSPLENQSFALCRFAELMNPIKIHLIYSARSFVSNNGIEVKLYDLKT